MKFDYLTMSQFAAKLGITKSRLSQILGEIHPPPIRLTQRHNSPLFFRPSAKRKKT